jgi:hypothetical protein
VGKQLDGDQFLTGAGELELLAHFPEVLRHHVAHAIPVWAANLREKTSVEELGLRSRQLLSNLGCVSVRANGQLALEFFEVCLPSARAVPFVVYEAIEPFSDR